MAYTQEQRDQTAASQRYCFSRILHEVAAPMIMQGADNLQVADALCQKLGWCFVTTPEWDMIASLRNYLTL
jgi:hypothetical protein